MTFKLNIENQHRGFFSLMSDVYYFEKKHLKPEDEIYVSVTGSLYHQHNMFDLYFDQTPIQHYNQIHTVRNPGECGIEYLVTSSNYYTEEGANILRELVPIIQHRFIVKKHIQEKIDDFKITNFKGNIFGIQKRGTDMYTIGHGQTASEMRSLDTYKRIIEDNLTKYDKCFLMTDEQFTVDILKNTFGDKICSYDSLRSHTDRSVHFQFQHNPRIGEDVLIETILLGSCDKLFATLSNIPVFAIAYNNNFNYEFIDIGRKYIH